MTQMKWSRCSRNLVLRRLPETSRFLFCVTILAVVLALWIPQLPTWSRHSKLHPSLVAFGDLPTSEDEPAVRDLLGAVEPSDSACNGPPEQTCDTGPASGRPWFGLCGQGRVKSVQNFWEEVSRDPLLRSYYQGFDWERARMFALESPVEAYLNYKKDGRIVRTRKKVALPKGDVIITDGERSVRAYCCNELVLEVDGPPPSPPLSRETEDPGGGGQNLGADPEDLGPVQDPPVPQPDGDLDPLIASFYRSLTPVALGPFPTVVDPPDSGRKEPVHPPIPDFPPVDPDIPVPQDPPPAPVPEPSTLLLFIAGLGGLLATRMWKGPARPTLFQASRCKKTCS